MRHVTHVGSLKAIMSGTFRLMRQLCLSSYQLRELFVMVVLRCSVSNVCALFDKYWLYFTDDIQRSVRYALGNTHYVVPHEQLLSLLIHKLTTIFANSGGNIDE
jgi:hypothetical protein